MEKLGFSHVLQPYLDNNMKDSKKETGLWIKSNASANKSDPQMNEEI